MNLEATLEEIKKLDVADRLFLAHAIWESVDEQEVLTEANPSGLSDGQKETLGRRMQELDDDPSIGLTWDQMKALCASRKGSADV